MTDREELAKTIHAVHCCPCDPNGCPDPSGADYRAADAAIDAGWVSPTTHRMVLTEARAEAWTRALRRPIRLAKRSYPKSLVSTATVLADLEVERSANPYLEPIGEPNGCPRGHVDLGDR